MKEQPLLSLYIPIYNRIAFLERQLSSFMREKELFEDCIQLTISDNCSEDDLKACCEKYQHQGLNLIYHRNETNIGPDRNFMWCFYDSKGKYTWLLGSDDIPVYGLLSIIVQRLKCHDYGLIHLIGGQKFEDVEVYDKLDDFLSRIHVNLTFMSVNIIKTNSIHEIDLRKYEGTFLIQVPAYINGSLSSQENAIINAQALFDEDTDFANNGGFNYFKVFVVNFLSIIYSFVEDGKLKSSSYNAIKKALFGKCLTRTILRYLVFHLHHNYDMTDAWKILYRYYGRKLYAYWYLLRDLFKYSFMHLYNVITGRAKMFN